MDNVFCVAKEICKNGNWAITNLELQKILYIAQMFSYGKRGKPLFDNSIEAWDYGPVVPEVYHKLKFVGNGAIPSFMFPSETCVSEENKVFISHVSEMVNGLKGWELVAITHRIGGAWQSTYRPGVKHLVISPSAIQNEYSELWSKNDRK